MTERDKELAKQAGMFYRECSEEFCSSFADGVLKEEMEKLVTLIRADEREQLAAWFEGEAGTGRIISCMGAAKAIRARGNT